MKYSKIWLSAFVLAAGFILSSCSESDSSVGSSGVESDSIEDAIGKMSLREKVGQMFIVRPEALDTSIHWSHYSELVDYKLQKVNATMSAVNEDYPIGGMILFAHNIKDESQLVSFVKKIKTLNGSPLLAVDEEGGRVARIANSENFDLPKYESMEAIAKSGDPNDVYEAAFTIGSYVKEYGFDIDFAPVADVNTNPENIVIGPRAFSDKPEVAAKMVVKYLEGLDSAKIVYVATDKTWDEMKKCEMVPFKAGIKAGAQMIMTAHIAAPKVTGNNLPSTLSPVILQDKLRGELGFKGVIVADAMDMGAIVNDYGNEEAAIKAIQAGIDIVLCPLHFVNAFDAVVKAVEDGKIEESRIDESVRRILKLKENIKK